MRELSVKELDQVSGGLRWRGREGSMNIEDRRSGYSHTPMFGNPNSSFPNPVENYRSTGKILPNRWSDLHFRWNDFRFSF